MNDFTIWFLLVGEIMLLLCVVFIVQALMAINRTLKILGDHVFKTRDWR
jgi:hypothetical protein